MIEEAFFDLFRGRMDCFGTDFGSCVPCLRDEWPALISNHLNEPRAAIGIYPIDEDGNVRWGCVDIDLPADQDGLIHSQNLRAVLNEFGLTASIEQSKSFRYHVWVFVDGFVDARTMRRALKVACRIADCPDKEVNPKQEELLPGQIGNYVRLPYPFGYSVTQVIDHLRLNDFLVEVGRDDPKKFAAVAAWYPEPEKRPIQMAARFDGPQTDLVRRLSGLTYTIFMNGPLEGSDRSSTLFKFVVRCRDEGFDAGETFELLKDFDMRHGKFYGRADREMRLQAIIEKVYG